MEGIILIGAIVLLIVFIRHVNEEERLQEEADLAYQQKQAAMQKKEAAVQEESETRIQTMKRIEANHTYQSILSKALAYFDLYVKEARSTAIGASFKDTWVIQIHADNVSVEQNIDGANGSFFNRTKFTKFYFADYGMDDLDFESAIAFFHLFHSAFSNHYEGQILVFPKKLEILSRWADDVVLREDMDYLEREKNWPHRSAYFSFYLDFSNIHPKYNAW